MQNLSRITKLDWWRRLRVRVSIGKGKEEQKDGMDTLAVPGIGGPGAASLVPRFW